MHIAVVSLGAFGHINPTLSVVTELVRRGVRVTYFTTISTTKIKKMIRLKKMLPLLCRSCS